MSRGAQLVASLVLALFGIGLAAAAMEAGVRVLHLVPDRFWQPDPLLGTELIPGKEGWWTQEEHEFIVPVRINSLGHRDIERPRAKPAGNRRILVIGDSHVEALQVPLEDAIFRRLESELAETADDVEVLGAGVSGYGTASQLLFFRDRGWKLEPDLVILAFYPGNDIKNNGPALEKALVPHYGDDGGIVRVDGGKPRSGGRSLLSRSKAYVYFRKLILTRQPGLASFLADIGLMQGAAIRQADAPQGVPLDYWVYAEPTPPEWAEAWRHTLRNLDDLEKEVTARGATFAVVIVTTRDRLYPDAWQRLRQAYPRLQEGEWDLTAPDRRILEWCKSRNVPCLQLFPAFDAERRKGGERLHFVHDGHWTAAGHALAAKLTADFISRDSLL